LDTGFHFFGGGASDRVRRSSTVPVTGRSEPVAYPANVAAATTEAAAIVTFPRPID
jgi:hypothetical protein